MSAPVPPREPFSYVSQDRGLLTLKIREPAVMAVFFALFIAVGVVFFLLARQGVETGAEGASTAATLILVVFGVIGLIGLGIALVRWRWKREYVRVMGRSPWSAGGAGPT